MDERNKLKKKHILDENEEDELIKIESLITDACQDANRNKVIDNFKDIDGINGNLSHQGVWKIKNKYFPKIKLTLPVAKKFLKNQLITNPEELKNLYLDTLRYRLSKARL